MLVGCDYVDRDAGFRSGGDMFGKPICLKRRGRKVPNVEDVTTLTSSTRWRMTCRRETEEEVRDAEDYGNYDEVSSGGLVALLG